MVDAIISESILGRSEKKNLVKFHVINLFDFSNSSHQRIDDYPFGGGVGMILKPEPMFRAYDKIISELPCDPELKVVFPTPDGQLLNHKLAFNLSQSENLIFICGHYKGIDQRIRNNIVTDEISIGDYVITGGELASIIILDASIRLIPGVLNSFESAQSDSFSQTLLDCPYYTRPEIYREMKTPEVLLSGNHGKIEDWKKNKRIQKTKDRRPDLWEKYNKLDE
jgi:tRNA (guanine37-N1)-methyltransferase